MLFDEEVYQSIYNDMMFYLYTILGCAGIIILSLIIILIISSKNKKIRKLVTVLEEKIKSMNLQFHTLSRYYHSYLNTKKIVISYHHIDDIDNFVYSLEKLFDSLF